MIGAARIQSQKAAEEGGRWNDAISQQCRASVFLGAQKNIPCKASFCSTTSRSNRTSLLERFPAVSAEWLQSSI
jgi:hypothetical protein